MGVEEDLLAGFAKALGVPADGALRAYVRDGRGAPPRAAKLLAWDANSIHAFVFDTTNATGIRGASDILRSIDRDLGEGTALGLAKEQVLFAGGGSGLAVVADGEVQPSVARLHEIFARETRIATCTAVAVDLVDGEAGFPDRVRAVGRALARDRILTGPDAEPVVPFFAERCEVCGRRAAAMAQRRIALAGGERRECAPCHLRIERGKEDRRYQQEPSGFEDVADDGGKGFYAVVYADGNGIGKTITRLPSPLSYATFSRAIGSLMERSFHETVAQYHLGEEGGEGKERGGFQLPVCGGDDLWAILPGEVAVPFTRDLLSRLEAAADAHPDLAGKNISTAAGVAIGRVTFPIRHLLAEAEGLLAAAKRRKYDDERTVRSTLSFAVVTDGSPRSETTEPERWARAAGDLLLSGRPYTLEELRDFSRRFRTIQAAEKIGKTQLHALHAQAARGPRQFRNHVLYQIGRRAEWRGLTVALAGRDESLLRDPDACEDQFAPTYGGRRVFDVADMIDLLGHWHEPEESGPP
jgi:CRISPR RNA silencing complex Cmr2 subunit-like protein